MMKIYATCINMKILKGKKFTGPNRERTNNTGDPSEENFTKLQRQPQCQEA